MQQTEQREIESLPGRILLDTCILNMLYDEGEYIFDNYLPDDVTEEDLSPDLICLRQIVLVTRRAAFQFVVSPISVMEVSNTQDYSDMVSRLNWLLEMLEYWLGLLEIMQDRTSQGGSVRHRFKLSKDLQEYEEQLMKISDLRRDPLDRLLLVQYKMGNCDAFLTIDENTIWRHRKELAALGVNILRPLEFWDLLRPWAALWY